ncbi:MAG: glycosyltransferase family 2 protein [Terriglobia bacterium]|nr:glycosyltransferase family 2 protein [Terriglobia bacterium]
MRGVALIVVHYRTLRDTLECIESILALDVPPETARRLIVVDNGSDDDSWEELLAWRNARSCLWSREFTAEELPVGAAEASSHRLSEGGWEIVLLRAAENRGYAAGANLGVRFVEPDQGISDFWVLNSDLILDPLSLACLLTASQDRPPAIYGATLVYMDDPTLVQAAGGAVYFPAFGRSRHYGKRSRVDELVQSAPQFDYIVGAAMFFSRKVLAEIGFLPEYFFIYFEETEWCARARARGIDLVWVPAARLVHKEGKSTGAASHFRALSDLSFRYVVRNSLLFTETRYPFWLTTVLLFNIYECLRHCAFGDFGKPKVLCAAVREYWELRPSWAREVSALGD